MKFVLALFLLSMAGCTCEDFMPHEPRLKCVGGVTYVMENGAWVEALLYKGNRCLPIKADK